MPAVAIAPGKPLMVTPPSNGPVLSLADMTAHRNGAVPTDQQAYLTGTCEPTAEQWIEDVAGAVLLAQTRLWVIDAFPDKDNYLTLPLPPLRSVDYINYVTFDGNTHLWDPSNYIVDNASYPGRIVLKMFSFWPGLGMNTIALQPANAVQIQFKCGWDDPASVPAPIKQAMLLLIGTLFENRESNVVTDRRGSSFPLTLDGATQTAIDGLLRRYRNKVV